MSLDLDVNAAEAARRLGVTTRTLRRWVSAGTIPYYRTPGGHLRFSPAKLEEWKRQSVAGSAAGGAKDDAVASNLAALEIAKARRRGREFAEKYKAWLEKRGRS